MNGTKYSDSDLKKNFSFSEFPGSLSNDLKAVFFYHFQKALNLFWQNQNLATEYDDLIDRVFYIEEANQSFSFYLVFSDYHIQIYHQYNPNREVDVKIIVDKKELFSFFIDEFMAKINDNKAVKDDKIRDNLENLRIYGKVKLAKQLITLISELDFDAKPYIKFILPTPLIAILKQLPIDSINEVIKSLLRQVVGTIKNLKNNHQSVKPKNLSKE